MKKQLMMFGAEAQLDRISKPGDPLEKLNAAIDREIFCPIIKKRIRKEDYSKGSRPPMDEISLKSSHATP